MSLAALKSEGFEDEPDAQQTTFEGFPVIESRYKLASKPLLHGEKLELFEHITGTFSGRVKSVSFAEQGERELKRVWEIEVLEARLDA